MEDTNLNEFSQNRLLKDCDENIITTCHNTNYMKPALKFSVIRIGDNAPSFEANTTFGRARLEDYRGRWLCFFSHPRRFYTCMYN